MRDTNKLRSEEGIGFAARHFRTFVNLDVLQGKYVIFTDARPAISYKFDAAAAEQDILAATAVVDAVGA